MPNPFFVPVRTPAEKKLQSVMQRDLKDKADEVLARPNARFQNGMWNPRVVSTEDVKVVAQVYPKVPEQQGRPGEAISGFGLLNRPLVTPEMVERLPGPLQPLGRAGRELTSVPQLLFLAATAGVGPAAAGAIRGGTGLVGAARGLAAGAVAPVLAKGGFTARLGAEAGLGTAATLAGQETAKRIPETAPTAVKVGLPLAAGLAGGVGAIGGARAAGAAGKAALRGAESAPVRAPGKVLPEAGLRLAGAKGVAGGALDPDIDHILSLVDDLDEAAKRMPEPNFAEEPFKSKVHTLREDIEQMEARIEGMSETRIVHPRWATGLTDDQLWNIAKQEGVDPYKTDWGDAIDSKVIKDRARTGFYKSAAAAPSITTLRQDLRAMRSELTSLEAPTPQVRIPRAEAVGGERQATMGAGFETNRTLEMPMGAGAARREPLASRESLAAAQARREATAKGQQELIPPPTKPDAPVAERGVTARGGVVPSRNWETGAERPFAFAPNSTANQGGFRLLPAKPQGKYITRQSGTPGVSYIVDTETYAIQAVWFNKATFNESQASQWLEANKSRFEFSGQAEAAEGVVRKEAVEDIAVAQSPVVAAEEAVAPPAAQVHVRRPRARVTAEQQAPSLAERVITPEESVAAGVSAPAPAAAPPPAPAAAPPPVPPRRPGGARAIPLEPRQVPPRQPSVEAGEGPPGGKLPSGREVGGPGRAQPPPPRDPYGMLKASLEPERDPLLSRVRTSLPQELYDRNLPLKELEAATGVPTRKAAQVVPGAMAAGEDIVRRFYAPIVKTVEKDLKFLERYMVLMRDSDILARNPHARLQGGIANEGERQIALAALRKDAGATRFTQIERAAADLWRANDEQVLRPWLDEGIIDAQMYRDMKSAHPHYIPFMRDDFAEVITNSFSARPEANLSTTGIRKMGLEGSERTLSNPLLRLLQQPIQAKQTIFRNRAAKSIVRALEEQQRLTGEELVRYIDPKKEMNIVQRVTGESIPRLKKGEISQQWETISFFENGVKNRVEVPSIYGRVAKGLEAEPDNILLKGVRIFNAPLRLGATTFNPFFTPTNMMRDAMSVMFREKVFPFGPDYMAGLWAAIRKNADFSEASQAGALLGGLIDDMSRARILKNPLGGITVRNPWEAVTLIPRLIEEMNIIAERGVRIATFRKLRAEGVVGLEAAVRSRDATVDFAKSGHAMKVINQVLPFTNAATQGTVNIARTIRDHPGRSAAFATVFAGVAITVRVNNMRFETSELIPDYEYTRNWVVQFGEGTRADGTKYPIYLKIPKGEIAALFTFVPEALFNLARKSEDRSASELLLSSGLEVTRAVSPIEIGGVTGLLPPALETGVGLQTGVAPFTGAPLIPERLRGLPPEQQFTKETSQTAIQLGRLFKVSPMLVDFALNDAAAGGGQTLNWLLSMGLEALGVDVEAFGSGDPDTDLVPTGLEKLTKERTPGISRFIGTRDTQLVRRGYDNLVDAVVDTNRAIGNFPDVSRLGIKFGQVQGTIGDTELTPQQRARYQELAGQLAIEKLQILQAKPIYATYTDERKEERIREEMDEAREDARALMKKELRKVTAPGVQPARPGTGSSTWERRKQATPPTPSIAPATTPRTGGVVIRRPNATATPRAPTGGLTIRSPRQLATPVPAR